MRRESLPNQESVDDKLIELKRRKGVLAKKDILGFHEDSTNHALMVEKIYKERGENARQYKAFHMLIGSTTNDAMSPYYDFPEPEYSIEKFIEKKESESRG